MLSREQIAEYYSRGKQIGDLAEYRALSKSQQIVQESLGYVYSNYPCMLKEPINYTVLLGIWATLLDERDIYPTEADYDARRKVMNFVGEVNKGVIPYIILYGRQVSTMKKIPYIVDYLVEHQWEKRQERMQWIREHRPELLPNDTEIQVPKETQKIFR